MSEIGGINRSYTPSQQNIQPRTYEKSDQSQEAGPLDGFVRSHDISRETLDKIPPNTQRYFIPAIK